jgi:polysaccharide pyruvyl transferase WcaK-like protein
VTDGDERPGTASPADAPVDPPTGRRPRVFLVGYYGMDNLGDDAIRDEIERIAERIGLDVWRVATRRPRRDARAVWLTPRGARHYLAAIVGADRVVIGGGGILKDEGLRLPLDLAITCLAARLTRTPVTLVGVGVGPFYTRFGRWLIGRIAASARYRSVRDEASAAMLASLGIDEVDVGADPVFAAERRRAEVVGPSDPLDPARPPTMLVSLRAWFLKDPDGGIVRQAALWDAIAAAIAPHAEAGWQIEIVPLYYPRDVAPARALADRLPPGSAVTVVDAALDWDALLDRLTTVDLVVTMRFHALAAALIEPGPGPRPCSSMNRHRSNRWPLPSLMPSNRRIRPRSRAGPPLSGRCVRPPPGSSSGHSRVTCRTLRPRHSRAAIDRGSRD